MRQKLLIIDDSRTITSLVQARLADEPIEVFVASDGVSGLQRASEVLPDLILLDVDMPQPDGFAVCRELKTRPETMQIPVVFLTGVSSAEEKIRGLELGAVDYITKPFDPAELRARVRASLRTKYLLDLLSKKAQIDGLSGLWNRGYFDHRLRTEISLCRRTRDPLSIVMADIDHFKQINDQHGHPSGDEVVRRVGQLLMESVRTEDIVCRYGGEEYAVILPNTPAAQAAVVAERMRLKIVEHEVKVHGASLQVTASFGVCGAELDAADCVIHADEALYRAKRSGRNRVEIAMPDTTASAA